MAQPAFRGNVTVAVFNTLAEAENAVSRLRDAEFDPEKISMVEACRRSAQPERSLLDDHASFSLPGVEELRVAGPLASWMVAVLENAAVFGDLTPLAAALYVLGVDKGCASSYEAALRSLKCLVIAHGSADEAARAKAILDPAE